MDCLSEQDALDRVAMGNLGVNAPGLDEHLDTCDGCRRLVSALAAAREANDGRSRQLAAGLHVGRYVLCRPLGEGGMAVVWEADDLHLGRKVALKWLHPALSANATAEAVRILREARAVARLNHPNVVTLYDTGEHEGESSYIAMELAPGGTLTAWLRRAARTPAEIVDAFVQAGRGLAAAHRAGIVHGDFKPDNVLRSAEGAFKVTDFGLAGGIGEEVRTAPLVRAVSGGSSTVAGGTPFFMPPERLAGGPPTPSADEYSFGIALAAALGAARGPADIASRVRGVPVAILAAIARATAAAADARFATMDELLAVLDKAITRRAARRRLASVGAAVTTAVAIGSIGWALWPGPFGYPTELENGGIEEGGRAPQGWHLDGRRKDAFALVRTEQVAHGGRASAELRPLQARSPGYGVATQKVDAHDFRGKRVRAAAWVRTAGVTERADVWIRALDPATTGDGPGLGYRVAALDADSDWKRYLLEVDVPTRTSFIELGIGMDGPGALWFDDVTLGVVP